MNEFSYYRNIESHTLRCEITWAQVNFPALSYIYLLLSRYSLSAGETVRLLLSLRSREESRYPLFVTTLTQESRTDHSKPYCIFCRRMFESSDSHKGATCLPVFNHIAVHADEYDETEVGIFESLEEAKNLHTSNILVATSGESESFDGDPYLTPWIQVSETGSLYVNFGVLQEMDRLNLNTLTNDLVYDEPCNCQAGSAIFFAFNWLDQVIYLGEVPEDSQSHINLSTLIESGSEWEDLESFASRKWQSLAAPDEDWILSEITWIGCLECSKPVINPTSENAKEELLALAFNELREINDPELLQRFEEAMSYNLQNSRAAVAGYNGANTVSLLFDQDSIRALLNSSPDSVKSRGAQSTTRND